MMTMTMVDLRVWIEAGSDVYYHARVGAGFPKPLNRIAGFRRRG